MKSLKVMTENQHLAASIHQDLISSLIEGEWRDLSETVGRIRGQLEDLSEESPLELAGMGLMFGILAAKNPVPFSPSQILVRGGASVLLSRLASALSSGAAEISEKGPIPRTRKSERERTRPRSL